MDNTLLMEERMDRLSEVNDFLLERIVSPTSVFSAFKFGANAYLFRVTYWTKPPAYVAQRNS